MRHGEVVVGAREASSAPAEVAEGAVDDGVLGDVACALGYKVGMLLAEHLETALVVDEVALGEPHKFGASHVEQVVGCHVQVDKVVVDGCGGHGDGGVAHATEGR